MNTSASLFIEGNSMELAHALGRDRRHDRSHSRHLVLEVSIAIKVALQQTFRTCTSESVQQVQERIDLVLGELSLVYM